MSSLAFSQTDYNKWSLDLGLGINKAWAQRGQATRIGFPQIAIGGRYMINNDFGLKLGLDYNRFKNKDLFTPIDLYSVTGSAVVNVGHLLRFETFAPKLGLLANIGAGASFEPFSSSSAVDKMLHGTVGFTPQYRITEKIAVNLTLSSTLNILQQRRFDGTKINTQTGPDGVYSNLSAGVSIYFGERNDHADWTPTEYGAPIDNAKYDAYEARIAELEAQLADDDNDGVNNARDLEPGTAEDAIVDSKGRTLLDTDGDKIPDVADLCPNDAGLYSDNGCPDTDNDGVDDLKDKCPDVPGVHSNDGCPVIEAAVQEVLTKALKGVQFETGKDVLLTRSFKVLDAVVEVMEAHPEYYLEINGHTDNVGDDAANMELSKKRSFSVMNYLVEKGVEAERLHPHGYGETQPKVSNETPAGQAKNRRVEFKVVFE